MNTILSRIILFHSYLVNIFFLINIIDIYIFIPLPGIRQNREGPKSHVTGLCMIMTALLAFSYVKKFFYTAPAK